MFIIIYNFNCLEAVGLGNHIFRAKIILQITLLTILNGNLNNKNLFL